MYVPPAPPSAAPHPGDLPSASAPPPVSLARSRLELEPFRIHIWRIAMRVWALVFVLLRVVLAPAAATAQDAAALRREIEQLQKQLQSVTERLQRLEAQPPAAPGLSAIDLARPRQPFGLYQQRGAGQLLFDI